MDEMSSGLLDRSFQCGKLIISGLVEKVRHCSVGDQIIPQIKGKKVQNDSPGLGSSYSPVTGSHYSPPCK